MWEFIPVCVNRSALKKHELLHLTKISCYTVLVWSQSVLKHIIICSLSSPTRSYIPFYGSLELHEVYVEYSWIYIPGTIHLAFHCMHEQVYVEIQANIVCNSHARPARCAWMHDGVQLISQVRDSILLVNEFCRLSVKRHLLVPDSRISINYTIMCLLVIVNGQCDIWSTKLNTCKLCAW